MRPLISYNEAGFCAYDALIFSSSLVDDVNSLLPLPGSIGFCFHAQHLQKYGVGRSLEILETKSEGVHPFVLKNMLIIPLPETTQGQVDLVVYDIDSALLNKMDQEWLVELQEKIIQQFFITRQRYIDPSTGLYNQRALELLITEEHHWKTLFLIATVSRRRTVAGGYQKITQLASLLEAVIQEPLFYFGQGVFGSVSHLCDHKTTCSFSRRLISRLKREKLYRVHIGFSCLAENNSAKQTFTNCWDALVEAEQRGPFSLCDADSLHALNQHPFSLPETSIVRSLQRKWCGIDRFGLALFSVPENSGEVFEVRAMLTGDEASFTLSPCQQLVIFPDLTGPQTAARVDNLVHSAGEKIRRLLSVGYSNWPVDTGLSKTDCIRRCKKAIMHGSFLGSGAVVGFDYISLNVSGDFYFDEGDYKRAIKEYRLGLQMQPDDENLLNSLGVALAEVNRHREAIACFSQVLKSWPDNYMALVNKGMSCRYIGQNTEAIQCFEQALRSSDHLKQASLELYLQLGRMYCFNERFDDAVHLLEQWQSAKGEPEEFMFFKLLGEASLGVGRHAVAIRYLQRSLQLYPRNADSLSMLGLLYVLEEEGAKVGLDLCDRAIIMDESEVEHMYRRAVALFHLKRYEDSLVSVRKVVQRQKNHDRAVLLRGEIYENLGFKSRAEQSFQRVLTINSAGENRIKQARNYLKKLTKNK